MDESNNTTALEAASLDAQRAATQVQVQRARQALTDAQAKTADFVRQHPVVCIGGAVVAGYLLGRVAAHRWLR